MRLVESPSVSCTDLGKSVKKFLEEYKEHKYVTMSPIEALRDFFLSPEAVNKGIRPGVQQDAVEALRCMLDEIGMLGDLVRSRHEIYPEGVVSVALDKQFHDHSEWRLEQVLQTTHRDQRE